MKGELLKKNVFLSTVVYIHAINNVNLVYNPTAEDTAFDELVNTVNAIHFF
jgi:hypothetical protein